ncbi:MAG: hypothetical protein Q7T25_08810, partial [Sideroxyarcus sp.]|nr:hypothetical protein [Sideroxyarcus sp.]
MDRATSHPSRRGKWLLWLLTPCLVLAGSAGWLVASTSGLQWLLGVAERQSGGDFRANGISGSLLDAIGMQQLVLRGDGWRITLHGAQLQWQPAALLQRKLNVLDLSARQVDVLSLPSDKPVVLPDSLRLPLDVSVSQVKFDSLRLYSREGAAPDFAASDVEANFESEARHFQLRALHARLPYGEISGSGEIALDKPYALKAQAALDAVMQFSGHSERTHFAADAGGDLQHLVVKLDGKGAGMNFNGTTQLAPFSAVPVSRVQIAFGGMDTRRLFEGAPPATLSGSIDLHGTPGGILEGSLQVRNAHAAPLDQNGLPLLGVTAQVRLSASHWQLQQLDVRLPNDGHITGTLSWEAGSGKGSAQLQVHDLAASALHTRLPNTRLQGDIALDGATADLHAVVALSDGKLEVQGELRRQGGQIELSEMRLTRGETVLTGHGRLALDRRRSFRFISQ